MYHVHKRSYIVWKLVGKAPTDKPLANTRPWTNAQVLRGSFSLGNFSILPTWTPGTDTPILSQRWTLRPYISSIKTGNASFCVFGSKSTEGLPEQVSAKEHFHVWSVLLILTKTNYLGTPLMQVCPQNRELNILPYKWRHQPSAGFCIPIQILFSPPWEFLSVVDNFTLHIIVDIS